MFSKLPSYKGSYNVGFVDVETKQIQLVTDKGLYFRIYYPTNEPTRWSSWLPNRWDYSKGYGNFLKSSLALVSLLYYPAFSLVQIPVQPSAPIADKLPKRLPICIFSHGLAGMRTTYSNLCGNLASRGVIVVALEHGDGSACFTRRTEIGDIPHHHPDKSEVREGETESEYLLRLRTTQLHHRRDEILDAVALLEDVDAGNLRNVISSDRKVQEFLSGMKERIDFRNMMIMGHSFGGATAIEVLNHQKHPFECAVMMDPWMYAVTPNSALKIPTLNVQSHVFHWKKNLDAIKALQEHPESHPECKFAFIRDTKHNDFSDFGLAFTRLMLYAKQTGPADPLETHAVQDELTMDFVSKYIELPETKSESNVKVEERVVFGSVAFDQLYDSFPRA